MKITPILLFVISCLFLNCYSTVNTVTTGSNRNFSALPSNEPVYVFNIGETTPASAKSIGTVRIDDSGFSINCGFEVVIELAKNECRKVGGNGLKIISLREPDINSSCYRLIASILRVDSESTPQPQYASVESKNVSTKLASAISLASNVIVIRLPESARIAVLNISSDNTDISSFVIDELEFQLVSARKMTIVDRKTLDAIRSEQKFQMSGDVSDASAVSIGQMLGANIVITGNVSSIGTKQRLSIRALDVKTAEIVAMAREEF